MLDATTTMAMATMPIKGVFFIFIPFLQGRGDLAHHWDAAFCRETKALSTRQCQLNKLGFLEHKEIIVRQHGST